jgi:hypothetical protein
MKQSRVVFSFFLPIRITMKPPGKPRSSLLLILFPSFFSTLSDAFVSSHFRQEPRFSKKMAQPLADHPETSPSSWQTLGEVASITSPWLSVYCERLRDDKGKDLDYWRVEKDHSVVVLTIYRDQLIFPVRQYRPGCREHTLDFPGGRVASDKTPRECVSAILARELGIDAGRDLQWLESLTETGWFINSSFSNQRLFGFVAVLYDHVKLDQAHIHDTTYQVNDSDAIQKLLQHELLCLQCRSILMAWLFRRGENKGGKQ